MNPSDDPAGLAESIALNAQIGQTNAANSNVSNAISFSQTQDGYLQQVGSALDQMSTLAVEAQDVTKTNTERADYQSGVQHAGDYITEHRQRHFNGVSLFSRWLHPGGLVTTDGSGDTFTHDGCEPDREQPTPAPPAADISTTTGAVAALTAVTAAITAAGHGSRHMLARTKNG